LTENFRARDARRWAYRSIIVIKEERMKTLVVYYSLEGNTEYVANKIKEKTGADVLKLVPQKAYPNKGFGKFFFGGGSSVIGETRELEPYEVCLDEYERVILGFPVWAARITPPLRMFIEENKSKLVNKNLIAYACQSGNGAEKAFAKLAEGIGVDGFEKTAVFLDPKSKHTEEKDKQIEEFCEILK
jgi:flavodoxin